MLLGPYLSICRTLREKVPAIKHYDLYNGQYLKRNDKGEIPFKRPAVFIQYGDVDWVEQGRNIKEGDALIMIHCVTDTLTEMRNMDLLTPGTTEYDRRARAYAIDEAVQDVMEDYTPEDCIRAMRLRKTIPDWDHDGLMVNILVYETRLRRAITDRSQTVTVTSVNVSGDIVDQLQGAVPLQDLLDQGGAGLQNENGQNLQNPGPVYPPIPLT